MALDTLRADSARENPSSTSAPNASFGERLDRLVLDIQSILYKLESLGYGVSHAVDSVADGGNRGKIAAGMVANFADLIVDQAKLALSLSEDLEGLVPRVKREA